MNVKTEIPHKVKLVGDFCSPGKCKLEFLR